MTSRKKRAERGRVWAQEWADKHGPACVNCGERGAHYAPGGLGTPGRFVCKPKTEEASVTDETEPTAEELAEFRRSDTWKLDQAEETLNNLGWEWDEDEGAWTR